MKKIYLFLIVFLFLFLISCNKDNNPDIDEPDEPIIDPGENIDEPDVPDNPDNPGGDKEPEKTLSVTLYYEDMLLMQSSYTKEEFELEDYLEDGYEFKGWYLDANFNELFDETKLDQYFEMKEITLYARMRKIMTSLNINIIGKKNNEYVLNPAFNWAKENSDSKFIVTIYEGENLVESANTTDAHYNVKNYLKANTEYTIIVTEQESEFSEQLTFKTINESKTDSVNITLGNPFMDDMVIQRNEEIIFSGKGTKNQLIELSLNNNLYYGIVNEDGNFEIEVPAQKESFDPINIILTNNIDKELTLNNVLFGDVYLFAGQSNMQWPTINSDFLRSDVTNAINSKVRFFCQDVVQSTTKLENVTNGRWFAPDEYNYKQFSAIAFMSGSMLSTALATEVPIGIVTAYQGDTNIANWMSDEYYAGNCNTKYLHYNAMIYPLRNTKLTGVVWYQGCNNSAAGIEYKDILLKLFENYRDLFNSPDLPFFVIGLCCYDGDSGNNYDFSYVRESQALACSEDDKAFFISTCDNGDPTYIHPSAKRYICERVSKSIQGVVYNKDYLTEGPSYLNHEVSGNTVTITLKNSNGLYAKGDITNLYLAGEDGKYYLANAKIENGKIVASCDKVENPVYIKYGFGKSPFVNIFNKDNFAIVPFRTDNYNLNIDLFDYTSTDIYKFHPDGSQMEVEINENNNLLVTKTADGKSYGSIRLETWGAIAYEPQGFRFTVIGTNSNASITFRAIEGGSYEIWGYKIIDDFIGERTFEIGIGEFSVVYNKQDSIFNTQKIDYLELMIESMNEVTIEIKEARFISIDKTEPMKFSINACSEAEDSIVASVSNSVFAENYTLTIYTNEAKTGEPLYSITQEETMFSIPKNKFVANTPYYVFVTATNNLGNTDASNNGLVFYLKDNNAVIVCNFDFSSQASLDAYISSSMDVHSGLSCVLDANGVKINSSGAGWQQFIFKLDTGLGDGMTKLKFNADFSNYNGLVILQLADTSWGVYQYDLDLNEKNSGEFVIDFSSFKKSGTPFTTQNLMWVMFNFSDSVGNGYIILDNVQLTK